MDTNQRSGTRGRPTRAGRSVWRVVVLAAALGAAGCNAPPPPAESRISAAAAAYESGDYARAYQTAAGLVGEGSARDTAAAAYLAGISAQKLGDTQNARRMLERAVRDGGPELLGDAAAALGLVYAELGMYDASAQMLLRAAGSLRGEDKANAYFYAAVAQQKLGRWAQARTNLVLARSTSQNAEFWQQASDQLAVTGYTVQVGAFAEADNAKRAASGLADDAARLGLTPPRLVEARGVRARGMTLVQVGAFATFDAALRARNALGATGAIIVPLSGE